MFTGIVETLGDVREVVRDGSNIHITISSKITSELQIDQSMAHNGVCLTVVAINDDKYTVTAIDETLIKTNLGQLSPGDKVNLERCVRLNSRLDGHIVQGHVDTKGKCTAIVEKEGSWEYRISLDQEHAGLVISKGSICVNGVSLTVVDPSADSFGLAIIPFTFDHTTFHQLKLGDDVNLEFDILGKYILRNLALSNQV